MNSNSPDETAALCPRCTRSLVPGSLLCPLCEATSRFYADPRRIGPYQVLERLFSGASGSVFRCQHPRRDTPVAIKVLHGDARGAGIVHRFRRQAPLIARLHHPNVARLYATGRINTEPFVVMELMEGPSVAELLRRRGRLDPKVAVLITREAARGLAAAHSVNLLHRDVKPTNLFLTCSGEVKVSDFGLAGVVEKAGALAPGGTILGTPAYCAPEQAQGQIIDHRADIYSLGVTLFHMLTGTPPFADDNPVQLLVRHMLLPIPALRDVDPALHPVLTSLVRRMTAKNLEDRFASYEALIHELDEVLETLAATDRLRLGLATAPVPGPTRKEASAGVPAGL